jgi:hypothetical protein
MATVAELIRWIREYGQDARHSEQLMADEFVWYQLWMATDIIGDVDWALSSYLDHDFPEDIGERYLKVYGAMQALYIQQDALTHLCKVLWPSRPSPENTELKKIRYARNASVGHPTELRMKGGMLSTQGIVRVSLSKDGFDLMSYPSRDGDIFQHVPVRAFIGEQRVQTENILTEVVNYLREQEEQHRAQFRDLKLVEAFRLASHAFEKIFEGLRAETAANMGKWGVGQLQTCLDSFEAELKKRGMAIGTYDTVEYLYEDISFPLKELKKFFEKQSSEIASEKGAVIFAEALQGFFSRLRGIAEELDEHYGSAPDPIAK